MITRDISVKYKAAFRTIKDGFCSHLLCLVQCLGLTLIISVDELHDLVDDDSFLRWTGNCRVFISILHCLGVSLGTCLKVRL